MHKAVNKQDVEEAIKLDLGKVCGWTQMLACTRNIEERNTGGLHLNHNLRQK
jgi:hypothetical protein